MKQPEPAFLNRSLPLKSGARGSVWRSSSRFSKRTEGRSRPLADFASGRDRQGGELYYGFAAVNTPVPGCLKKLFGSFSLFASHRSLHSCKVVLRNLTGLRP